ncbi:hypothetical protein D3C76_1134940 [compost metagenome]
MDGAVQCPRGDIRGVGTVERAGIVGVHQDQVAGADFRKVLAVGIDQELAAIGGHRQAEMVGDGLVQAEASGPTEGAGKIDPCLPVLKFVHGDSIRCGLLSSSLGRPNRVT